jgi:diamine N-acetyltransferase
VTGDAEGRVVREIQIREVTRDNWHEALQLAVTPEQEELVAPVTETVAEAYIRPKNRIVKPYAFYAEEQMIGFFAYSYEPESTDDYWIEGFFIDHRFQRMGLGSAALAATVTHARSVFPKCRRLSLTVFADNVAARRLYEGYGFGTTGEICEGDLVYHLDLAQGAQMGRHGLPPEV